MKFRHLALALVGLLLAAPAMAAEGQLTGDVSIGLRAISGDNVETSAKFREYRDYDPDHFLYGQLSLFGTSGRHYLTADVNAAGAEARLGCFDNLKFSLFYNKIDHNYTFGALTPYHGVGEETLTVSPGLYQSTTTNGWHEFDYTVERKLAGAKGEISLGSPFFLAFNVTQTDKDGVMPWGVNSSSTSPGSFFTELPMPIDYKTTTASAKVGYRTKSLTAALEGTVSSFDNDNDTLNFQSLSVVNPAVTVPVYLAPDNDMAQFGGELVFRELPLTSTLALRGSYAKLESDADILGYQEFDGELTYTTASVILRSRPTANLETEIAYRYVDKENDSDQLDTGAGENELFEYTKHNASVEAGYRLPGHNRLAAGYEYTNIERAEEVRPDAEETEDHKVFAEWKNSALEMVTAKLRYEHLWRDTDFPDLPAAPVAADYERPYDAATKDQDTVKVGLDISPCANFDMGIEYKYENADYKDTEIGRTDETSQEVIVDGSVDLPAKANLYLYAAYEQLERELQQRRGSSDPYGATQDNTNYNWKIERQDDGWSYGAKLTLPLFEERLKLTASWDYQQNEGDADFTTGTFPVPAPGDIDDKYGDYDKRTLALKAEYAVSSSLDFTVGYLYEKYRLDDLQYNDYQYIYSATTANTTYLSGAYADPDYEAKIGYMALKYKF